MKDYSKSRQCSKLTDYNKLTINFNNREISFSVKIDSKSCYSDEEYCGALYVNLNKNTDICFFDIKNALLPIFKHNNYIFDFMNNIENMYLEKKYNY